MQVKALKVFCDVVEQRSFSEAAAENGVSQSATSQMVSHVEDEMGAKFIDRSQRPIALLPAGELFYKGCRRIVDQFESCLLYTSPSPRDRQKSRMPSSA